jgi:hypothetical protein
MDTDTTPPTMEKSTTAMEPTTQNDRDAEETIREENGAATPPKDIRFWLIIMSLLVATFLAALDLTGTSHYLLCPSAPDG